MPSEEFVFEMDPDVLPAGKGIRVPPGDYSLELLPDVDVQTSSSGFPMIVTQWTLGEPISMDAEPLPPGTEGARFWMRTTLQPGKLQFARALWEALGLPWGGKMSLEEAKQTVASAAGTTVVGIVKDHEYDGEISSQISRVKPLS